MPEFTGPWAAPRPIHDLVGSLDQAALQRVIHSLTNEEREALWQKLVEEANTVAPADPREELRWHVERERRQRFDQWFRRQDAVTMSRAYLRMIAGDDLEEIMRSHPGPNSNGTSHD